MDNRYGWTAKWHLWYRVVIPIWLPRLIRWGRLSREKLRRYWFTTSPSTRWTVKKSKAIWHTNGGWLRNWNWFIPTLSTRLLLVVHRQYLSLRWSIRLWGTTPSHYSRLLPPDCLSLTYPPILQWEQWWAISSPLRVRDRQRLLQCNWEMIATSRLIQLVGFSPLFNRALRTIKILLLIWFLKKYATILLLNWMRLRFLREQTTWFSICR